MKKILPFIFCLTVFTACIFADNEIQVSYESGQTLYATYRKPSNATVWNDANDAWETWADSSIDDYDLPLTNGGGDLYYRSFDTDISAGLYIVNIYLQAGGTPATTDALLGSGEIVWDGSSEVTEYSNYLTWSQLLTYVTEIWMFSPGGF